MPRNGVVRHPLLSQFSIGDNLGDVAFAAGIGMSDGQTGDLSGISWSTCISTKMVRGIHSPRSMGSSCPRSQAGVHHRAQLAILVTSRPVLRPVHRSAAQSAGSPVST